MIALLVAAVIGQGSPEAAANEYKALEKKLAQIHSIEGELTTWRGAKSTRQVHFEVRRPNLYRVQTTYPGEGTALGIGDGKHYWHYTLPEKTYIEKDAKPDRTSMGNLFEFEQFDSPDEIYYNFRGLAREDFRGRPAESIEVYFPNNPDSTMKFYIDPDSKLPLGFRFAKGKAVTEDFVYSNLKINPATRAADFVFRIPSDAKPFSMPQFDLRSKLVADGAIAPDFKLSTPSGKDVKLSDFEKANRLVLLDFWFRDCEPCQQELAHMSQNYAKLKKEGVEVLAVDCGDTVETVKNYVAKQKLGFPVAMDRAKNSINGSYGVQAFPTTYVIAPDGKIIASYVGFDEKEMTQALTKALQSSKP